MYVCMYVGMYVRYGFTIKIYGFAHSLCTSLACAAHDAIAHVGVGGQKSTSERGQRYGRRLTTQQKDERQQDNGDRRRLALHDLLCLLTVNRIGEGDHGVVLTALRTLRFTIFSHVLGVWHIMRMRISSI